MTLHFLNDVFRLNFALEPTQGILQRLAFLQSNFCQTHHPQTNANLTSWSLPRKLAHYAQASSPPRLRVVEITSEEKGYPVESGPGSGETRGWRADSPGTETIRLVFDQPQRMADARFEKLCASSGVSAPPNTIREIEEYRVELSNVTAFELVIVPHTAEEQLAPRSSACACLDSLRPLPKSEARNEPGSPDAHSE